MTRNEFRQSKEYADAMKKIRSYKSGFHWSVPYYKMTDAQCNAMRVLLGDAEAEGLIESISLDYSLDDLVDGKITEETWRRR